MAIVRHREIDRNALLDEINQLKQDREQDKQKLVELTQSCENMAKLMVGKLKIGEYYSTVLHNLDSFTYEDKRLALDALGVPIVATSGHYQVTATLPVEISETSDRTVGTNARSYPCMFVGNQDEPLRIKYITALNRD